MDAEALLARTASQQYPAGVLYVVATPIGNLGDVTLRALHVLSLVDAIACEDTRVGASLLRHLGLPNKPLLAAHQHNEREAADQVLDRLARGERVALLSDAGTPAVSDPGARLVACLRSAGVRCIPVPGPCAATAALSVAGDVNQSPLSDGGGNGSGFRFVGFLPSRGRARTRTLTSLLAQATTLVVYESPHRIATLAAELGTLAPERDVTVARELTKQFEEVATVQAPALSAWVGAPGLSRERGEYVLVVHAKAAGAAGAGGAHLDDDQAEPDTEGATVHAHDPWLRALLATMPLKQVVALAQTATGLPRNALYARALALRDEGADQAPAVRT
jgi:16S rRNA (cytidine1402-2'-O)-methyltransferase